jgi:lipopolysaccharide transport system ATP-binding protein
MKTGILETENLGIRFWLERRETALVRDILFHPFQRRSSGQELWALRGVSFVLERGQVLGVIGRNGAGKTTLLMALARIYAPDEGSLRVRGKVTSLLEVGAGFRLDLTGRENVYLYAAIMGIQRREVNVLFDRIVDFAGLEDFIDAPMRTYSSGMKMRLGFSVAVSVQPDILLVDEALSIGDSAFQNRAQEYIQEFRRKGGALVYVSHDMTRVGNLCDQCLLLENGRAVCYGKPLDVIATYWERIWGTNIEPSYPMGCGDFDVWVKSARRWGSGEVRITDLSIIDRWDRNTRTIEQGSPVTIEIRFKGRIETRKCVFQVSLFQDKTTVAVMKSDAGMCPPGILRQGGRLFLRFDSSRLAAGDYTLDAEIREDDFSRMYDHLDKFVSLNIVQGPETGSFSDRFLLPCQWTFTAEDSRE